MHILYWLLLYEAIGFSFGLYLYTERYPRKGTDSMFELTMAMLLGLTVWPVFLVLRIFQKLL